MVGNPDLADVISQAAASDAKVILAGDTQQLQAVESGGGLRMLADALGFVQLTEPAGSAPSGNRPPACGCAPGTPACWPSMTSAPGSPAGSRSR